MIKNLKEKGNQFFKEGQYHMAINLYKKYVAKPHPDNKNAYYNMGLCMYKAEKYQECIQACKQALKLDENYLKVYYRLALAYQKVGNQYQTFVYASSFCEKSKSQTQSNEYQQMQTLSQNTKEKIMYPNPIPIEEKFQIFYESQPDKKSIDNRKQEYFQGYKWQDVQKNLDSEKIPQALNKAYGICRNGDSKRRQGNEQNLKLIKKIKNGALPKDTKILTDVKQLQKQKKNEKIKELKQIQAIKEEPQKNEAKTDIEKDQKDEDFYRKYFLEPLQKKKDVFEGFPDVVMSILRKKQIENEKLQEILQKVLKEYGMFSVLQMSMSTAQKNEIKKQMENRRMNEKFIKQYCN